MRKYKPLSWGGGPHGAVLRAVAQDRALKCDRCLDRLEAEIARLKEALDGARKDLAPIHMCDVISRDCAICKTVLRIDAALACHPQGERSET